MTKQKRQRSPWWWVPSLYFAEGIPYVVAMTVSIVMYKTMGISNTVLAFWTSLLYLPWVIKPLWSPLVDIISTKRNWVLLTQFLLGACFLLVAVAIKLPLFFTLTLLILWLVAFASATHDIAADGFYMIGLDEHRQAWFVGIRSTFYRIAMIAGQGLLVMLAGYVQSHTGLEAVNLNVMAMPRQEIVQPMTTPVFPTVASEGKPRILIYPEKVQIPLYNPAESNCDSSSVYIRLSAPPDSGKQVVVNFGRKKGSKDILLVGTGRFVFDYHNWDKPVKVVLKVDHRLKEAEAAVFAATAGDTPFSWTVSFGVLGIIFLVFAVYHQFILPKGLEKSLSRAQVGLKELFGGWLDVFRTFFRKPGIGVGMLFLLFYRFAESQLVKIASPFLLDRQEVGGLALTTTQVGFVYGTVGIICLTLGGILGGIVAARDGLKKWVLWMVLAINIPDLVYVYLAYVRPDNFVLISLCVAIEQFGYGFGFTGYMLYMLYLAEGEYKTSHYAIATAFMALGMMLPGMISGKIQEMIGYQHFFVYVMLCTIPSFLVVKFVKIEADFGKRKSNN